MKVRQLGIWVLGLLSAMTVWVNTSVAKEYTVAIDIDFVPFSFEQNNQYTGFDVDLFKAIAEQESIDFKFEPMVFKGIIPALQDKQIDAAIAGITIQEERQKIVDFSQPYYHSGLSALILQENLHTLNKTTDFAHKTLAVKTGTAGVDFAKVEFPQSSLKAFPNINNAFVDLLAGRVDGVVHDTPNLLYYANTQGKNKTVVIELKEGESYGIAFPKHSELLHKVNAGLQKIKENGEYERIFQRWFGPVR